MLNVDHRKTLEESRKGGERVDSLLLAAEFGWEGLGMGKEISKYYSTLPPFPNTVVPNRYII